MSLDKTDFKILYNLDYNARIPLSALATKTGMSKQNLHYRLKKLINERNNPGLSFPKFVATKPGCRQFTVTPLPLVLRASS